MISSELQLLTDPFLQLPTENSVRVVWFTEFAGCHHIVEWGKEFDRSVTATTIKLSRTREDRDSNFSKNPDQNQYLQPIIRHIWRHEAEISGLVPGQKVPYRVTSTGETGTTVSSAEFTLAPKPMPGMPLKILLTSDHQLKPMVAANLQKVTETIGQVDAIFFAGDLVNVPDRASEWFEPNLGNAFFPNLQGRSHYEFEKNGIKTVYQGGKLIQYAPLFPTIGNHEVMGRFSNDKSLNEQFYDAFPRTAAMLLPQASKRENWLQDNSFNTETYEEIFSLPTSIPGGKKYYAVTFGDVRLVVLYVASVWRSPSIARLSAGVKGRYEESDRDLNNPTEWGYGQHIFEPICQGSTQHKWLETELNSDEFKQAKYKVVMLHHPPHSLGDNAVPAYTDPVQIIERSSDDNIISIRYEYPKQNDYIIRDVVPLIEASGVQLVLYGHSHLWNRFMSTNGTHYLETSNVGNSYGAAFGDRKRLVPSGFTEDYIGTGDPNGLEAIVPTIAPLMGEDGQPLPYIASNDITVFSILDTETGTVSSYRFDTREPNSEVVKFDRFELNCSELVP